MDALVIGTIIKVVLVLLIVSALAGFGTYIERKVLAFMQRRLGPTHVGPFGLLQIAADGIKLFTKEDIIPQYANKFIFSLAPVITAATAFIALSAVPLFPTFVIPESPLNQTIVSFCIKFEPLMVITEPIDAVVCDTDIIIGSLLI